MAVDIKQYFMYYSTPIPAENVFFLTEEMLDDLYANPSETERFNVFFHLQNEYFFLKNNNQLEEAAYLCYLISYYLFIPLTPPHSDVLALEFAKKAVELNLNDKYNDWLKLVKKGN